MLMVVELSVENCVVWLVSASDLRKYEYVPGLQVIRIGHQASVDISIL